MKQKKIDALILDTYKKLYYFAGGDFDELVENAEINEKGEKEIPFMDYELDGAKFEDILHEQIKKFKVPKRMRQPFKNTIYLGCSPNIKR